MTDNIESALTPISEARRMLALATTLPELRQLRDYATGAKAWAKARGMGIDAENEATEIILRAEREIGAMLNQLGNRSEGQRIRKNSDGQLTELQAALADLGMLSPKDGHTMTVAKNWQTLARVDDDRFEAMIRAVRAIEGSRLAKANFYSAIEKAERVRTGTISGHETPSDPGFGALLTARNALLGWEVNEDGVEGPTRNGLLQLADDQLRTVAAVIKALATAYTEARSARSG